MHHNAVIGDVVRQDIISIERYGVDGIYRASLSCDSCSYKVENNRLISEVAYWRAMHSKSVESGLRLKEQIEELEAKLRLREHQLFSRKSEKRSRGEDTNHSDLDTSDNNRKRRGQQPGAPGHGRRRHNHLPIVEEVYDIPDGDRHCSFCGFPFKEFPGTDDSEEIVINVKAHRRLIRRKRYKRTCLCSSTPVIVSAPAPAKLIPRGSLGITVWAMILIDKFLFHRPTYRLLEQLKMYSVAIPQGSVTDGLKRLVPLFAPIMEEIIARNRTGGRWHADETHWLVFATVERKVGYRWYLWVYISDSTVVYKLDPTRSSKVPLGHFDKVEEGILIADRYSAYKVLLRGGKIKIAYCWAHVRRDFLSIARDWPKLCDWAMGWIEKIGNLYHLNNIRFNAREDMSVYSETDTKLRRALDQMHRNADEQLTQKGLHPVCSKVLKSLGRHWEGLTLFRDYPEVPMDNNRAERAVRGPVIGRKNYYGSGSIWSGHLLATMMSIFQTLLISDINPQLWLTGYLQVCADNGGNAPEDISGFLPWNMSDEQRVAYSMKPEFKDSS